MTLLVVVVLIFYIIIHTFNLSLSILFVARLLKNLVPSRPFCLALSLSYSYSLSMTLCISQSFRLLFCLVLWLTFRSLFFFFSFWLCILAALYRLSGRLCNEKWISVLYGWRFVFGKRDEFIVCFGCTHYTIMLCALVLMCECWIPAEAQKRNTRDKCEIKFKHNRNIEAQRTLALILAQT